MNGLMMSRYLFGRHGKLLAQTVMSEVGVLDPFALQARTLNMYLKWFEAACPQQISTFFCCLR